MTAILVMALCGFNGSYLVNALCKTLLSTDCIVN